MEQYSRRFIEELSKHIDPVIVEYFNKKKGLLNAYSIIQGHILRISGFLKLKQYKKVKSELGDLFINLSELAGIMDERDYTALKHLKDILIENLQFGLLGHVKLKNEEYVKAETSRISAEIDKKVDDLAIFIKKSSLY